jgi:hypothetical protein
MTEEQIRLILKIQGAQDISEAKAARHARLGRGAGG